MRLLHSRLYAVITILICTLFLSSCAGSLDAPSKSHEAAETALSPVTEVTKVSDPETSRETTETASSEPETVLHEASLEFINEVRGTVEEALNEYALFFIYQGFDLESYVDPDSPLYGYLFGSDSYNRIYNEYYNYEYIEDYDYSLFETSDYIMTGEDSFTVNVRYKLDMVFTYPDELEDDNQRLDATWTFRNTDEGWKLSDISNNGQRSAAELSSFGDISVFNIRGKDYDGVLMIINDASKIFCGTVPYFAYDYGQTVPEMIDTYSGYGYRIAGGINGGNFDDGGTGSSYTAMPLGVVISEGDVVFDEYGYDYAYHLTGFDEDGKLILGDLSVNEALSLGIRDAVYTTEEDGPFLIIDGEIMYDQLPATNIYGAGKNPRTAIGQRKDGSIIMLAINGRQPSSLGASFEDLALIMKEADAENASAMDGGTSSQMILNGEILNQPFSAFGLRMCPTAWLILE